MKKHQIFSKVVDNAFDFFEKSLTEFDNKHYKYSIIHFSAAVELFLKARLLCEHWTLILSKQKEPNLDEFLSGDSCSATLDDIKRRLRLVAQDGLSTQASNAFENLAKHRNRVIHFCHPLLMKQDIPRIAGEQCLAWYYLQELLTIQWERYFKKYSDKIKNIDGRIRKHREYLKKRFDLVKKGFAADVARGIDYEVCPTCKFKSLRLKAETTNLFNTHCTVCDFRARAVRIDCPSCNEAVTFISDGYATCSCGKKLDSKDLFEVMFDHREADLRFKDGDDSYRSGNCCHCEERESVIPYYGEYLCLSCFGLFRALYTCGWCNELQTDSTEDSYLCGCQFCDGKLGDIKDD